MKPFQVPDSPYTIDRVMDAIRVQIVEPGNYPGATDHVEAPPSEQSLEPLPPEPHVLRTNEDPLSRLYAQLDLLRQHQGLDPGYRIRSHRPLLGPLLSLFKRVVHWGARPYTDAVRLRQEAFNNAGVQLLQESLVMFEKLYSNIEETKGRVWEFYQAQQQRNETLEEGARLVREIEGRYYELDRRISFDHNRLETMRGSVAELNVALNNLQRRLDDDRNELRRVREALESSHGDLAGRIDYIIQRLDDHNHWVTHGREQLQQLADRVNYHEERIKAHNHWAETTPERLAGIEGRVSYHDKQLDEHNHWVTTGREQLNDLIGKVDYQLRQLAEHNHRITIGAEGLDALRADVERLRAELPPDFRRYFDLQPFLDRVAEGRQMAAFAAGRGTAEQIGQRQLRYVELFFCVPGPVLDIGCGRGEFLKVLREHGLEAYGADPDPAMLEVCRREGLHVVANDALGALREACDGALGGIFAAQVVEHMFPAELLEFLQLARRKLGHGGRIVLETVNPSTVTTIGKSWSRDLDHKVMIHPDTLKGILDMAGFTATEAHGLNPYAEDERLPDLPEADQAGLELRTRQRLQACIDRLNAVLFGNQDYYVTGRQGVADAASPDAEVNA